MTTKYSAEQASALADLQEAGMEMTVALDPMEAYDPRTGRAMRDDGTEDVVTYGILTSVASASGRWARDMVDATLAERVRFGATLASLPLVEHGGELKTNSLLTAAGVTYRVLGVSPVQPDGVPIIHKLALEVA